MFIIVDFRRKHQLSQQKLAEILGTSQGRISHYETGRRTPNIEFARDFLAKSAEMGESYTLDDLVDGRA